MIYTVETELKDFNFWSGAIAIADDINALDNAEECWDYLENYLAPEYGEQPPTETEVNDFLWFYAWDVLLGECLVPDED